METRTVKKNLLQINLRTILSSTAITSFVLIALIIVQNTSIRAEDAVRSLLISATISLSIANGIHLVKKLTFYKETSSLVRHLLIWSVVIVGLFIGFELALLLMSFIYQSLYVPFSHVKAFLPWAGLAFVIGIAIYLYKSISKPKSI